MEQLIFQIYQVSSTTEPKAENHKLFSFLHFARLCISSLNSGHSIWYNSDATNLQLTDFKVQWIPLM